MSREERLLRSNVKRLSREFVGFIPGESTGLKLSSSLKPKQKILQPTHKFYNLLTNPIGNYQALRILLFFNVFAALNEQWDTNAKSEDKIKNYLNSLNGMNFEEYSKHILTRMSKEKINLTKLSLRPICYSGHFVKDNVGYNLLSDLYDAGNDINVLELRERNLKNLTLSNEIGLSWHCHGDEKFSNVFTNKPKPILNEGDLASFIDPETSANYLRSLIEYSPECITIKENAQEGLEYVFFNDVSHVYDRNINKLGLINSSRAKYYLPNNLFLSLKSLDNEFVLDNIVNSRQLRSSMHYNYSSVTLNIIMRDYYPYVNLLDYLCFLFGKDIELLKQAIVKCNGEVNLDRFCNDSNYQVNFYRIVTKVSLIGGGVPFEWMWELSQV